MEIALINKMADLCDVVGADVEMTYSVYAAGWGPDAVVIVIKWNPSRALDLYQLKALMA